MKTLFCSLSIVIGLFFSIARPAFTQISGVIEPPPILKITKLVAKPGKLSALVKIETERAEILKTCKWPRTLIASTSVTGPSQIWIFARYNSLGDLARDQEFAENSPSLKDALDRLDGAETELMESRREITATYQKDISYRTHIRLVGGPLLGDHLGPSEDRTS